jgi:mRNA interferase MazF
MERPIKGDVVVVNFPFTDLSGFSKRPALVLASLRGEDTILCQITTQQSRFDEYALTLEKIDFDNGKLVHPSYIRVNKLFTASKKVILNRVGRVKEEKLLETEDKLFEIIKKRAKK